MNEQPIMIKVKSTFLPDQSLPSQQKYVFGYTVTIENHSEHPAQLLSRHWIITDANNGIQEVQGEGVIGEKPRILPGADYTYSSFAILNTQTGMMEGTYTMRTDSGNEFNVPIPAFSLTRPQSLH